MWIIIAAIIIIFNLVIILHAIFNHSWENDVAHWTSWYALKEYFFSYSELTFFQNLLYVLKAKWWDKYLVFPKVRLADIMETTDWKKWITRIWSKHVDFLIVDKENHADMMLAIELNWPSHWSKKQEASDDFKIEVFDDIGLPLIYFDNNQANNKRDIYEWIKEYLLLEEENSEETEN